MKKRLRRFFRIFGPGFITGAADNDPAGIATYTQVGAQFGYGQLWTAVFALPLLMAVQEACARIGAVTGKGLATVIKEHYNKTILYGAIVILLVANTLNIGADIGAMGESIRLVIPLPFTVLVLFSTFMTLVLEIFTSYRVYARYLKWLAAVSFLYLATVFVVSEPWTVILRATFVPHIEPSFAFFFIIVANIGTTISPYMFFWEASEEVEEAKQHRLIDGIGEVSVSKHWMRKVRLDNAIGMFVSQLISWSIIVVAGTVLYANGITTLTNAADAAKALEPLVHTFPYAGTLAKTLFAIGIISAGLLVVPILSGSAAYALSETVNWKEGLNLKLKRAHGFYGIITIATLIGLSINFFGINPIRLLIYTSVLNGVAAVPLLFLIARIGSNKNIMGEYSSGKLSLLLTWIAFVTMAGAAIGALLTFSYT